MKTKDCYETHTNCNGSFCAFMKLTKAQDSALLQIGTKKTYYDDIPLRTILSLVRLGLVQGEYWPGGQIVLTDSGGDEVARKARCL
jgi:hypothetical protein